MCKALEDMGLKVECITTRWRPPGRARSASAPRPRQEGDEVQILKYCVHNVAHLHGKTATFMPKPLVGDNGSGMHVHQSLQKAGTALFAGDKYGGLSDTACTTSAASSSTPGRSTPSPIRAPTAISDWCGLRGAGDAGLFGAQPQRFDPHSLGVEPEGAGASRCVSRIRPRTPILRLQQ